MTDVQFQLSKDIVFFDIESTGLNIVKDRIIQIALIKYTKDSLFPEEKEYLLNPGVPISEEAHAVHGISVDMVRNKPSFSQIAEELFAWIGSADLSGYNSDRFDIPMLMEEFARAGFDFNLDNRNTIDVQKIFYKMEPRTLKAALKFYCGKDLEGAHDALADVRATVDVLKGQLVKYDDEPYIDGDGMKHPPPIQNDMKKLSEFTFTSTSIDVTNRLKYNSKGVPVFNFGKYSGRPILEVFRTEPNYYKWIMDKEFSVQVKKFLTDLVKQHNITIR